MLTAEELVEQARQESGHDDFGGDTFREGLDRLTEALVTEAELNDLGEQILGMRIKSALVNRLRVEDTVHSHPEIADEVVEGPIVILGLPRTGTTAPVNSSLSTPPCVRFVSGNRAIPYRRQSRRPSTQIPGSETPR